MTTPWWVARVQALLDPPRLEALGLGQLWRLREQLEFVRLNVQPELLAIDVTQNVSCAQTWNALAPRAEEVAVALRVAELELGARLKSGALAPEAFLALWAGLGFARHADGGGTPADDYLDGMFHLSRLEAGDQRVSGATLNLSSRAERVSDFLSAMKPGPTDVVFDLGSGSGKVALTVAASTRCSVHGVEIVSSFVDDSRRSADSFGMSRAQFTAADVRDVDFSGGTIFYLFHPFHGPIAQHVAASLAELALRAPISLYVAGPQLGFGEHFQPHLASGALRLVEHRGEFGEVSVLASSLVPQT
jgi:hypothetical protein